MSKRKRLDHDAEQVAIYLNTAQRVAMNLIAERRKKRGEDRTSPSEIVADSLWRMLSEAEGVSRRKIEELVATKAEGVQKSDKVKLFPKIEGS